MGLHLPHVLHLVVKLLAVLQRQKGIPESSETVERVQVFCTKIGGVHQLLSLICSRRMVCQILMGGPLEVCTGTACNAWGIKPDRTRVIE